MAHVTVDSRLCGGWRSRRRSSLDTGPRPTAWRSTESFCCSTSAPACSRRHRPSPVALRHSRLASFCLGSVGLRPQREGCESGRDAGSSRSRSTSNVGSSSAPCPRYGCRSNSSNQSAVVGSGDQHHLHVVLHPAVRRRGGAVAAKPGGGRRRSPTRRCAELHGPGHLRCAAGVATLWAAARCRAGDIEGGLRMRQYMFPAADQCSRRWNSRHHAPRNPAPTPSLSGFRRRVGRS